MTPDRRNFVTLSSLVGCAMLPCLFFSLRHSPHHAAFSFGFWNLFGVNSWLQYRDRSGRRTPDTLIHLFPEPPANLEERA